MSTKIYQAFLEKAEELKNKYKQEFAEKLKAKTAEFEAASRKEEDPEAVLKDL